MEELLYYRRINTLTYDAGNEVLSITFQTGSTQRYCKVPGKVYRQLEKASNQNEYYNKNILGNYPIGQCDLSPYDPDKTTLKQNEWM